MPTLKDLIISSTVGEPIRDPNAAVPMKRPEAPTTSGKLQRTLEGALEDVKDIDSGPLNALVGGMAGLAKGVGWYTTSLSSSPLSPMNLPVKVADALISGKASDIIRPQFMGDSPMKGELDSMLNTLDEVYDGDSSAVEFSQFLGEFIPGIMGAVGAANTSRAMTMKYAPKLMESAATRKLANQFGTRVGDAIAKAGGKTAEGVAKRAAGTLTGAPPYLERTLMAAGNGMGLGAFEFTRELNETGELVPAVKSGALGVGLGFGIEMGMVLAGRAIFPSFRAGVDKAVLEERWAKVAPELKDKILSGDATIATVKAGKITIAEATPGVDLLTRGEKALSNLVDQGVVDMAPGFLEMTKAMTIAERSAAFKQMVRQYKRTGGLDEKKLIEDAGLLDPNIEKVLAQKYLDPAVKKTIRAKRSAARKEILDKIHETDELEQAMKASYHNINALNFGINTSPNLRLAWTDSPRSAAAELEASRKIGDALAQTALMQKKGLYGMRSPITGAKQVANTLNQWRLNTEKHITEPLRAGILEAPSSMAKRLGVSGLKFAELFETASTHARLDKSKTFLELGKMSEKIATIMERPGGLKETHKHFRISGVNVKDNAHLRPIRDTWEKTNSIKAIEDEFGVEIAVLWDKSVVQPLNHFGRGLQNIGVNSMMTDFERGVLRAPGYFPQVTRRTVDYEGMERVIRESMTRAGKLGGEIDDYLAAGDWRRSGAKKFGTIDQQRKLPGTTKEKINGTYHGGKKPTIGLPFEDDPIIALQDHFDASITRLHLGTRFGANFELGTFYKLAMIEEGGAESIAINLVDAALYQNIPNTFAARLARNINSFQIITKLSWAAIPNAYQTTLTGIRFGGKSTAKGLGMSARDFASNMKIAKRWQDTLATEDKQVIAQSLGLIEKSLMSTETLFSGRMPKTMMERVAERMMSASQFTRTERMNRVIAAHSGLAEARTLVEGIAKGKLIGQNLTNARSSLDSLGVNMDRVMKRYKATGKLGLSEGELDSVINQSVKQTQFATGALDIPTKWRTPLGRVMSQFKSFSFNAGRLIRDQVFREFDKGNYRPFLYYMSLGSASGEMIGLTLDTAKSRKRKPVNGPMRIVEDISNFGGFGLAMTMAQSAVYGKPLDVLLGPMAGDISGLVSDPKRTLARQPVVQVGSQLGKVGAHILDASADVLDTGWDFGGDDDTPYEPPNFNDMIEQQRRNK